MTQRQIVPGTFAEISFGNCAFGWVLDDGTISDARSTMTGFGVPTAGSRSFQVFTTRAFAEQCIARGEQAEQEHEEYIASPEYAGWLESMRPTDAALRTSLDHFMNEQGDLA